MNQLNYHRGGRGGRGGGKRAGNLLFLASLIILLNLLINY